MSTLRMDGARVCIIMDPLEALDIDGDTTLLLADSALRQGARVWSALPLDLFLRNGALHFVGRRLFLEENGAWRQEDPETLEASSFDVVLQRQDPPFSMNAITVTYLLEDLAEKTGSRVVNSPRGVRECSEKLYCLSFAQFMPPTAIVYRDAEVHGFLEEHGKSVGKPLYGCGGQGIFVLHHGDSNLSVAVETLQQDRLPFVVQKFLPNVVDGDKRILMVNGEPVGAVNRVALDGEHRSNLHLGGRAEVVELTARERRICAKIGPDLRQRGLFLAGLDVIDGHLTEINVTSPTGMAQILQLTGVNLADVFWRELCAPGAALG